MDPSSPKRDTVILHSRWVRYAHWTWTLGVMILIGSGWRIYNQDPLFGFLRFPVWLTLGGDYADAERVHNDFGLAAALLWHFAAMWLLFFSITVYTIYGTVSGHFRHKFTPISPRQFVTANSRFPAGQAGPRARRTQRSAEAALHIRCLVHAGDGPVGPRALEAGPV